MKAIRSFGVFSVVVALAATLGVANAASGSAAPVSVGAYAGSDSTTALAALETAVGAHLAIASSFRGWGDVFPDSVQRQQASTGHTLLIAWDLGATSATRFSTFTNGSHDAYLAQVAAAAHSFGKVFYIRPWAEMNADWVPFQPTGRGDRPAGGTYAQFIAAWRHIVTYFRTHSATNVRWVFNPTTDTYAETTTVSLIWPGASYVNVLGLDGYNWGNGGMLTWRTFADVYTTQYRRLTALSATLPVWVCEFGSKEPTENDGAPVDPAHSKAVWYQQMRTWLATATRIRALVMFDVHKERDWRIESDQGAISVMSSLAKGVAP